MPPALSTRVTRLLGIRYPIVQGGLARVAGAELAAAVSEAGGLGQIASAGLDGPAALRAEIRRCRALTTRPFAVNFPIGRQDIRPGLETALEEGVRIIALTAGNPAPYIARCREAGAKTLVLTAGPELARKAEAAGADMVATVGYEGGGHIGRGDETTLVMVPRVVAAVSIPVLASGGIATGAGLLAALALGAEGVEMGTRFVATREARAHAGYKQALAGAAPADTMIIKRTLGMPGRVLRSRHAEAIVAAEEAGAPRDDLVAMISGAMNARGTDDGDMDDSYVWAGQCVGLFDDVPPAGEVVRRMAEEALAGMARLRQMGL
ncbi:NAD(P)H-dependent flavin oxidoreductase [Paracraurococcus ruber]|uniref:2-nitropropane dioxygenase n=1 Tax=Paracraurococcus ruber TaxID=77675 RepID=A0ABS1CZI9_9PROT|nr:nitronate monooxygenase [Paracraurococcus ruber]MBK1659750.1 2-nitropropane dioxygenase [Paracraurococcus ruber]TDG27525.1 nitronate monooxygenase [Paracraurococcus ruber]